MGSAYGGQKMIPFDFDYYRPSSINEAVKIMHSLSESGKKAYYYAGGTELLTNFRKGKAKADAIIDIKTLPELTELSSKNDELILGAALSLNKVIDQGLVNNINNEAISLAHKAIKDVFSKIADHTTRNALTLGGNLCGRLTYKEAVLPLLAYDATVVIANYDGIYEKPLKEVFDKKMKLGADELLVKIKVKLSNKISFNLRETEGTETDYPVLHLFSLIDNEELFVGLSGYSSLPVYQRIIDKELIKDILAGEESASSELFELFESDARDCQRASIAYRKHLLKCAFEDMQKHMTKAMKEGAQDGQE